MNSDCSNIGLFKYLESFLTSERKSILSTVIGQRTNKIQVLLEDIYQPHNAAAVLRTCDAFGVQNIHLLEQRYEFEPSRQVSMGSEKWVSVHRYHSEISKQDVFSNLKKSGFKLVATVPNREGVNTPNTLPLSEPIVLMFGSERPGLTDLAISEADYQLSIPMYGFAESFNVSVSVALCLQVLTHRMRKETNDWQLTESEKSSLSFNWIKKSIKNADALIERFFQDGL